MKILKLLQRKAVEEGANQERIRIAKMIANSGANKISLNAGAFDGTYWVSANDIYWILMGKHLNQAFYDGDIPVNKRMLEITTGQTDNIR